VAVKKIALFFSLICAVQMNAQTWQVGNTTLTESDLVTGLSLPWEMVWGPDDFIWCTTRVGKVLRIDPSTGTYTSILDKTSLIPYSGGSEPGMLGMVLHPDFLNTPKVYVVYNYTQGNNVKERLSMFDWDGTALVNEVQLINAIGGNSIHNGSRLVITADQKILMSTGDTGDGGVSS
jgi:glucose/arabinose dehydrogenase